MAYVTEALERFKALDDKRVDRKNAIYKEINQLQKNIDEMQEQYTNALRQDDDKKANQLLDDISKTKNDIQFKTDKLNFQDVGENEIKGEEVEKAINEYHNNVDIFNKEIAKEENEIEALKEKYKAKARHIKDISQDFQQLHARYRNVLTQSQSRQDRVITRDRNYSINPTKYSINHIE